MYRGRRCAATRALRVTVRGGTADVYNPGKAGQDDDHKATYQFTELLDIVTAAGAADEQIWKVSAHCTTCDA